MRRGFKYPQPQVRFASLLLFDKGNKMKTYEEIAKEYSKTWSGSEEEHIDMGESENENDLFLFLVELAEKREIVEISEKEFNDKMPKNFKIVDLVKHLFNTIKQWKEAYSNKEQEIKELKKENKALKKQKNLFFKKEKSNFVQKLSVDLSKELRENIDLINDADITKNAEKILDKAISRELKKYAEKFKKESISITREDLKEINQTSSTQKKSQDLSL